MSIYKKDKRFISYLIILVALFILVLVTKDQYARLQENFDSKETFSLELQDKITKLSDLNKIKQDLKDGNSEVSKYVSSATEDELIDYFYTGVDTLNGDTTDLYIKNINFSEGKKNELSFNESTISLTVRVSGKESMVKLLDFLTHEESKYKFFIDSFFYPNDGREGSYEVTVPLKIFYR